MTSLENKSLEDKAILIKGKKYVQVSHRILYFNENYLEGSIETEMTHEGDMFIVKATVYPDKERQKRFTGHSQAIMGGKGVNMTAALENAETSAVGRALAMMGIGIIDSIASVDEMAKAGVKIVGTDTDLDLPF